VLILPNIVVILPPTVVIIVTAANEIRPTRRTYSIIVAPLICFFAYFDILSSFCWTGLVQLLLNTLTCLYPRLAYAIFMPTVWYKPLCFPISHSQIKMSSNFFNFPDLSLFAMVQKKEEPRNDGYFNPVARVAYW
jgi:hypothetical protein